MLTSGQSLIQNNTHIKSKNTLQTVQHLPSTDGQFGKQNSAGGRVNKSRLQDYLDSGNPDGNDDDGDEVTEGNQRMQLHKLQSAKQNKGSDYDGDERTRQHMRIAS